MRSAKLADRRRNRVQIALDQMLVEARNVARFYFCLLLGGFCFAVAVFLFPATAVSVFAGDFSVNTPPSASERASVSVSSTVCVNASSLFAGEGAGAFGALIVSVAPEV
jgi:hypothetical protein